MLRVLRNSMNPLKLKKKGLTTALTGVAQLFGHHPGKQKVAGSIPGQGTCLGCVPGWGAYKRQLINVFLSLPFSLSKNK